MMPQRLAMLVDDDYMQLQMTVRDLEKIFGQENCFGCDGLGEAVTTFEQSIKPRLEADPAVQVLLVTDYRLGFDTGDDVIAALVERGFRGEIIMVTGSFGDGEREVMGRSVRVICKGVSTHDKLQEQAQLFVSS